MIIVSHDRDFLQGLTNKVYEFKNQKIKEYLGDIDFFLEQRNLQFLREAEIKEKELVTKSSSSGKLSYEAQKKIKTLKNKLSKVEASITQLEKEIKEIDVELEVNYDATVSNPDFFKMYQEKKDTLEQLMENWEVVHLEIEAQEGK